MQSGDVAESAAELLDEPAEQDATPPAEAEPEQETEPAPSEAAPEQEEAPPAEQPKKPTRKKGKAKAEPPAAEQAGEEKQEEPEETAEEKARRECRELNALCAVLSEKVGAVLQGDIEFESLVSALQASTVEYDEISARLKHKRKTGELTRRSKRRLRRAGKDVKKHRQDLNVFMYYHDVNLLLLESPQSYACMLCQNRQMIETEDGDQLCRLRLETEGISER